MGLVLDAPPALKAAAGPLSAAPGRITVRGVVRAAASYYGMRPDELVNERRSGVVARRRHVAMYVAYALTGRGTPFIAYYMGRRSGGGIWYGVNAVAARLRAGHAGTAAAVAAIGTALEVRQDLTRNDLTRHDAARPAGRALT